MMQMIGKLLIWLGQLLVRCGRWFAPDQPVVIVTVPPGGPFSSAARVELEEMLGYERYVLSECGDAIRAQQGKSSPTRIIVNDSLPHSLHLSVQDTLGDTGAGMVRKMSPLVFTASYKLLDMVLEWTICQNGLNCPYQFERKIRVIDRTASLQYPDFLGTDLALRAIVVALYKRLTPYRNAITHHAWGQVAQGSLDFDFHRGGHHYQATVPFEAVLALADCTELIGSMLVDQSSGQHKLDTLRWLFDQLAALHGQPLFNIGKPRYFQVIRRTALPAAIPLSMDLDEIRTLVSQQAANAPATYDLTVFAAAAPRPVIWKIPFASLPSGSALVLDALWDRFKAGDPADVQAEQEYINSLDGGQAQPYR
jgi:hypothetical protein